MTSYLNGGALYKDELDKRREYEHVIVATTPLIDGYRVTKVVDVISAECVFGMNLFKDFFASFTDVFGGRSGRSRNALSEARQTCIRELKAEAHQTGANAVIGVGVRGIGIVAPSETARRVGTRIQVRTGLCRARRMHLALRQRSREGDHRHFGKKESVYAFTTPDQLIADFQKDIARWNHENSN